MFYRRKILLALIESFGGSLSQGDCQALLFLFCLRRGKNFYDFFTSTNTGGVFSVILQGDKRRLTTLGLLVDHPDFQVNNSQSYIDQLQKKDQCALLLFRSEIGDVRSDALLHFAHITWPSLALDRHPSSHVLMASEYEETGCSNQNSKISCLFTLGYEGLSIDAYLNILLNYQVAAIIDVRKNPISMKAGFSKRRFIEAAKIAGLTYIHIPELGIPSHLRKELTSDEAYKKLFEYYSTEILPEHHFAMEQLKTFSSDFSRIVLTCFEADPVCCHRHKIVEYLRADPNFKLPIHHLNAHSTSILSSQSLEVMSVPHGFLVKNEVYSLM